jgi:cytochrome c-type biogenesis protein
MEEISVLSFAVAFAAGFVSFASPCVLAVVPGYLTFISGVSFDELGSRTRDVMIPTLSFVAGFSLIFTAYGAGAGLIGYSLTEDQGTLNLVAGILLIVTGVAMVALPALGLMQTDRSSAGPSRSGGPPASVRSTPASWPTPRRPAHRGSGRRCCSPTRSGSASPSCCRGCS